MSTIKLTFVGITAYQNKSGKQAWIMKLQNKQTVSVTDALGCVATSERSTTFYKRVTAVPADIESKIGVEVEEDIAKYDVQLRPFVNEDGSLPVSTETNLPICDDDGNAVKLKWLLPKQG